MLIKLGWIPVYVPWLCGLWICMSLLGCSTLHHRMHQDSKSNPIRTVRLIQDNGSEHIEAIPSKGLLLCDLLSQSKLQSLPVGSASSSVRVSGQAPNLSALDSLSKTLNTALEDSGYDFEDPQVSQLIESMTARLQMAGAKDRPRQIVRDYAETLKKEEQYQPFTNYIQRAADPDLSSLKRTPQGSALPHDEPLEQLIVCITRSDGDQIVIPANQLSRSPLGGILLANGDTVSIHPSEDFAATNAGVSPRIVVTGMTNQAGQAIEMPSYSKLTQLHQQQAGPYADVAVVTRINPVGKLRHHIVPFDPDGEVGSDIDLQDGDLVYLSNLELLPIVITSKAISRELQLRAIESDAPPNLLRKRERGVKSPLSSWLRSNS